MIYFDNAATGGYKIRAVTDSVESVIKYLSTNPGRSGHTLSVTGAEIVEECRSLISERFDCSPNRVIFTKNCTEALNLAIFGRVEKGDHVITSVFEHNSVLRPLWHLKEKGFITLDIVSPGNDKTITQAIIDKINDKTSLIVLTSASNVTGEVFPLDEIGEICKKREIFFLVDGAQGGGHVSLSVNKQNLSALALAGHKGLGGIMGSGLLLLGDNQKISPLLFGGTGGDTFNLSNIDVYPDAFEVGTLNFPAIVSLKEGVDYYTKNLEFISNTLLTFTKRLIDGIKSIDKINLYSKSNPVGIVSFALKNKPSTETAFILDKKYDIAVRGAFHCAPLTHEYLNTKTDGLVRVSLSVHNTLKEIDYLISVLSKIALD